MEYTVAKLAKLAGVSGRTLRYYDQLGLLTPVRVSSSGYRIYGPAEVDRLQQILFYRELDVPLEEIAALLSRPERDPVDVLRRHREGLLARRDRLETLIATVDKTIAAKEGRTIMSDQEKFAGFIEEKIAANEQQYGEEIREKYGDEAVDASNAKLRNASPEAYERAEGMGKEILRLLDAAYETGDPGCGDAAKMAALHKEWLCFFWPEYSAEAHQNLCEMYVDDERFAEYYNRGTPGKAEFMRDAVTAWLAG